jgi:hypothetical protein
VAVTIDRSDFGLACSDYQLWVFPRGLGNQALGMLEHSPGWTTLAWEWKQNDKSQATVSFANLTTASDSCRGLFAAIRNWQHELVIIRRADGRIWSGPIVSRQTQSGTASITAYLLDYWLSHRDLRQRHNMPKADATAAYEAVWHDAIDRNNDMGYDLIIGQPVGVVTPLDIHTADHAMADQTIQPLVTAGLDYVTIDRTTYAGAPDTTVVSPQLLDPHVGATPDIADDGTVQANRYGVLGQASGNDAATAPYGESTRDDLIRRDGELVTVETGGQETTPGEVKAAADAGGAKFNEVIPGIATATLNRDAPHKLTDLIPGRLLDVRLWQTPIPVSGTYRITRTYATVDQNSGESVSLELVPVQAIDVENAT